MKNILQIFKNDLVEIVKNPKTLIIIIGLILLPCVYAWPNILSSWDPYSNTSQIKVAVVSLDEGTTLQSKAINIGNSLIENLKENTSLDWQFVDSKEAAIEQVENGNYYASIIIPESFTKDMTSVTTRTLKKAKIEYVVNEKINAISPKITSKGVNSIASTISKNFVETANQVIFKKMHEIGIEFEQNLPQIQKLKTTLNNFNTNFENYHTELNTAIEKIQLGQSYLTTIQDTLPKIDNAASNTINIAEKSNLLIEDIVAFNQNLLPSINEHLNNNQAKLQMINEFITSEKKVLEKEDLITINTHLSQIQKRLDFVALLLSYSNELSETKAFQAQIETITQFQDTITKIQTLNQNLYDNADELKTHKETLNTEISNKITTLKTNLNTFQETLNTTIAPKITESLELAKSKITKASELIVKMQEKLPEVSQKIITTNNKIDTVYAKLTSLNAEMPMIKEKLQKISDRFNKVTNTLDEETLFSLLETDYKQQAEFFANPIEIENHVLYPIENYGSAMTPFYTTLAIWVGALLMSSLLTTKVEDSDKNYKPYQKYLGRGLLFTTISLLQAFIIAIGDIYLLKTQAIEPCLFIVFALLIALLFSMIIYTIVSIFGNIGKALCIIALVLQMGASGGTFPIQMTPTFFQYLYPRVPFSYAISLLREAVGGVYAPSVSHEIQFLILAYVITISIGLVSIACLARVKKDKPEKKSKLFL